MIKIISVREDKSYTKLAISYFQDKWASEDSRMVYDDCINSCINAKNPLPQWYLLMEEERVIGCAGLITNDFISRMDLYPWLCALYIDEKYRGKALGRLLMEKAEEDSKIGGFSSIYLCTDHIGYYEHYGYEFIGNGYHPWGESSRIYEKALK